MHNMETAFDSIRDSYDLDTLREIRDHGCASGVANQHIYYNQTVSFYDDYEEEIIDYVKLNLGTSCLVELFTKSEASLRHYKNDVVWLFVECIAAQLLDEFETTMIEYEEECDNNSELLQNVMFGSAL